MKRTISFIGTVLVGAAVFAQDAATLSARQDDQTKPVAQTAQSAEKAKQQGISLFNKASTLIGMSVKSSDGKSVGKLQDLVFDLESNRVSYAVVAIEGQRLVPVPITALKPSDSQDSLILNISPSVFAAAPGIANDEWPALDAFAVGGPAGSEKGQGSSASQ
jgi:hypothetical protein